MSGGENGNNNGGDGRYNCGRTEMTDSRDADMSQTTVPVTYQLIDWEYTPDGGSQLAVADAEIVIDGVPNLIRGLPVFRRQSDGRLTCSRPQKKHPRTGKWQSAVDLPPELVRVISAEVLGAVQGGSRAAA